MTERLADTAALQKRLADVDTDTPCIFWEWPGDEGGYVFAEAPNAEPLPDEQTVARLQAEAAEKQAADMGRLIHHMARVGTAQRRVSGELKHKLRVDAHFTKLGREKNEKKLRGRRKGGRVRPENWRVIAQEYREMIEGGRAKAEATRRLDRKYFDRVHKTSKSASSRAQKVYDRWAFDL